jgi:hypothetical protein
MAFYKTGAGGTTVTVDDGLGNAFDHFNKTTLVDLINGSNTTVRQAGLTATRGSISGAARTITVDSALSGACDGRRLLRQERHARPADDGSRGHRVGG